MENLWILWHTMDAGIWAGLIWLGPPQHSYRTHCKFQQSELKLTCQTGSKKKKKNEAVILHMWGMCLRLCFDTCIVFFPHCIWLGFLVYTAKQENLNSWAVFWKKLPRLSSTGWTCTSCFLNTVKENKSQLLKFSFFFAPPPPLLEVRLLTCYFPECESLHHLCSWPELRLPEGELSHTSSKVISGAILRTSLLHSSLLIIHSPISCP